MRPKNPLSISRFNLRMPGRNNLSCTTPCSHAALVRELRQLKRRIQRVRHRLFAIHVFARQDRRPQRRRAPRRGLRVEINRVRGIRQALVQIGATSRQCRAPRRSSRASLHCGPPAPDRATAWSRPAARLPPCSRIARIERTRCWLVPMRPVTPFMMMPTFFFAMFLIPWKNCDRDRAGQRHRQHHAHRHRITAKSGPAVSRRNREARFGRWCSPAESPPSRGSGC